MALTASEKRRAGKWWVHEAILKPKLGCAVYKQLIAEALVSVEGWLAAAPGAGASNGAALVAALPTAFKNNTSLTQKELLVAAVMMVRAGQI